MINTVIVIVIAGVILFDIFFNKNKDKSFTLELIKVVLKFVSDTVTLTLRGSIFLILTIGNAYMAFMEASITALSVGGEAYEAIYQRLLVINLFTFILSWLGTAFLTQHWTLVNSKQDIMMRKSFADAYKTNAEFKQIVEDTFSDLQSYTILKIYIIPAMWIITHIIVTVYGYLLVSEISNNPSAFYSNITLFIVYRAINIFLDIVIPFIPEKKDNADDIIKKVVERIDSFHKSNEEIDAALVKMGIKGTTKTAVPTPPKTTSTSGSGVPPANPTPAPKSGLKKPKTTGKP